MRVVPYGALTRNPLMISIGVFHYDIAEYLIESGADVNCAVDGKGRTVLHYCAAEDNNLIEPIILAGADINIKDKDGLTALEYASSLNSLNLLIKYGAVPNEITLENAMKHKTVNNLEIIKVILKYVDNPQIDEALKCALTDDEEGVVKNFKYSEDREYTMLAVAAFGNRATMDKIYTDEFDKIEIFQCAAKYGNNSIMEWYVASSIDR